MERLAGRTRRPMPPARSGNSYSSIYGRMTWDAPSHTITTQCYGFGNGRFGHPEQDRAISLREAARLQTFPDNYEFVPPDEPHPITTISRFIGNAVPVKLARVIAKSIKCHLKKRPLVNVKDKKSWVKHFILELMLNS